jgi:hypothetical protein
MRAKWKDQLIQEGFTILEQDSHYAFKVRGDRIVIYCAGDARDVYRRVCGGGIEKGFAVLRGIKHNNLVGRVAWD